MSVVDRLVGNLFAGSIARSERNISPYTIKDYFQVVPVVQYCDKKHLQVILIYIAKISYRLCCIISHEAVITLEVEKEGTEYFVTHGYAELAWPRAAQK